MQHRIPRPRPIQFLGCLTQSSWIHLVCSYLGYTAAHKLYFKILTRIPAFLFLTMAILMLIFMICATRTNIVYTLIFLSLIVVFLLLTAGYWQSAEGNAAVGGRCIKVSTSPVFIVRDAEWVLIHMYLLHRERELHYSSRVYSDFIYWLFSFLRLWNSHSGSRLAIWAHFGFRNNRAAPVVIVKTRQMLGMRMFEKGPWLAIEIFAPPFPWRATGRIDIPVKSHCFYSVPDAC